MHADYQYAQQELSASDAAIPMAEDLHQAPTAAPGPLTGDGSNPLLAPLDSGPPMWGPMVGPMDSWWDG